MTDPNTGIPNCYLHHYQCGLSWVTLGFTIAVFGASQARLVDSWRRSLLRIHRPETCAVHLSMRLSLASCLELLADEAT